MSKEDQNARDKQVTREIIKLFWRANFQQKWSLFLGYVMRITSYVINYAIVPLFVAYGLQAIIARHFDTVRGYALGVLLSMLSFVVFIAIGEWAIIKNALVGSSFLQKEVFSNFLNKDYEFYSNAYHGSLGSQAIQLRESYNLWGRIVTLDIPRQSVTVVAALIVIGIKAPLLALVTLACMSAVLSFTILGARWRLKWRREVSEAGSELGGVVGDALTHSATVKSFAMEHYEETRFDISISRWKHAQYKAWITGIPSVIGRNLLAATTITLLLLMTSRMYQNGVISVAIVALVQLYVIRMIVAATEISEIIRDYEAAVSSAYASLKTMLVEPTIKDNPNTLQLPTMPSEQTIAFNNVVYQYGEAAKHAVAVDSFSLNIEPGEKVGLIGYSGSGKTTLTKLLLRFLDVTNGSITIGGVDLRDASQKQLRQIIAYVPQEPLLFHRSIRENIAYGNPEASDKAVMLAAKTANVDEFVRELPNKYDTLVGERGVKLSGGQRQRVAIARAVLKDAPILVLDEATSALDSENEQLIQDALWKLMKGRTALVIAHRLSTIQRMDKIVVMDKGKIVQIGTHQELLKQKGIYAKLWAHQSGGYIVEEV